MPLPQRIQVQPYQSIYGQVVGNFRNLTVKSTKYSDEDQNPELISERYKVRIFGRTRPGTPQENLPTAKIKSVSSGVGGRSFGFETILAPNTYIELEQDNGGNWWIVNTLKSVPADLPAVSEKEGNPASGFPPGETVPQTHINPEGSGTTRERPGTVEPSQEGEKQNSENREEDLLSACKKINVDGVNSEINKLIQDFQNLKIAFAGEDSFLQTSQDFLDAVQDRVLLASKKIAEWTSWLIQEIRRFTLRKVNAVVNEVIGNAPLTTRYLANAAKKKSLSIVSCLFIRLLGNLEGLLAGALSTLLDKVINTATCLIESFISSFIGQIVSQLTSLINGALGEISSLIGQVISFTTEIIDFAISILDFLSCKPENICPTTDKWNPLEGGQPTKLNLDFAGIFESAKGIVSTAEGLVDFGDDIEAVADTFQFTFNSGDVVQGLLDGCNQFTGPAACGPPNVVFWGGEGSGGSGNAVINAAGDIIGIDITSFGNYTNAPFVAIEDDCGNGRGAVAIGVTGYYLPVLDDDDNFDGTLIEVRGDTVTINGADYFDKDITVDPSDNIIQTGDGRIISADEVRIKNGKVRVRGSEDLLDDDIIIDDDRITIDEGVVRVDGRKVGERGKIIIDPTPETPDSTAGEAPPPAVTPPIPDASEEGRGRDGRDTTVDPALDSTDPTTGEALPPAVTPPIPDEEDTRVSIPTPVGNIGPKKPLPSGEEDTRVSIPRPPLSDGTPDTRVSIPTPPYVGPGIRIPSPEVPADMVIPPGISTVPRTGIVDVIVVDPGYGYLPTPDGSTGGGGRTWADKCQTTVQRANGNYEIPFSEGDVIRLYYGDSITFPAQPTVRIDCEFTIDEIPGAIEVGEKYCFKDMSGFDEGYVYTNPVQIKSMVGFDDIRGSKPENTPPISIEHANLVKSLAQTERAQELFALEREAVERGEIFDFGRPDQFGFTNDYPYARELGYNDVDIRFYLEGFYSKLLGKRLGPLMRLKLEDPTFGPIPKAAFFPNGIGIFDCDNDYRRAIELGYNDMDIRYYLENFWTGELDECMEGKLNDPTWGRAPEYYVSVTAPGCPDIDDPEDVYPVNPIVGDVVVINPGFGYGNGDSAIVLDCSGEGESATKIKIDIDNAGRIINARVIETGTSFACIPEIKINTSTGHNAILRAVMRFENPIAGGASAPDGDVIQVVDCVGKV